MAFGNEVEIVVTSQDKTGPGFSSAGRKARTFEGALAKVGKMAAGFLSAQVVSKGFDFFVSEMERSSKAASNLEQAIGGTEAVFAGASGVIDQFAETSAESVGLSEAAVREGTTKIGASIKNMTGDVDFAAEKSVDLVTIGADLAATFGGTTKDAVDALGASLRGEADPAERLGLNLSATAVNAYRAEQGLGAVTTGTDEYVRTVIEMIEAQTELNGAMGQFDREMDTAAGRQQILNAKIEDLDAITGQATGWWARLTGAVALNWAETKAATSTADGWIGTLDAFITGTSPQLEAELNEGLTPATERMGDAQRTVAKDVENTTDKAVDLTGGLEDLEKQIDDLITPTLDLAGAEIDLERAYDDAKQAAKENGKGIDVNTEKGRKNKEALIDIIDEHYNYITAAKKNGVATDTLERKTERSKKQFLRAADAMGIGRDEAEKLWKEYAKIPKNVKTKIKADRSQAVRSINKMIKKLKGIPSVYEMSITARDRTPRGDGPGAGYGGSALARVRSAMSGLPVAVTSTYRSPAHNATIPGASPTSYHMDRNNPAVDVGGPTWALNILHGRLAAMGGWRELLWQVPNHYDHVHAARTGGIRSGLTLVGEEGPELVNLPAGSNVRTAGATESLLHRNRVGLDPEWRREMKQALRTATKAMRAWDRRAEHYTLLLRHADDAQERRIARIHRANARARMRGAQDDAVQVYFDSRGSSLETALLRELRKAIRARGGNVQRVLGT